MEDAPSRLPCLFCNNPTCDGTCATPAQLGALLNVTTAPAGSPYPGEAGTPAEGRALPPSSSLVTQETSEESVSAKLDREVFNAKHDFDRFMHEKNTELELQREPQIDENSRCAAFRHNSWKINRRRVWDSMRRTGQSNSRMRSFGSCGSFSSIEQHITDANKFRIRCNHCNDRLCVPCGNARAVRLLEALRPMCRDKRLSFITLTLRASKETLTETIDRIYKCFKLLRTMPLWADKVRGGAAFLETKKADGFKRWHTHLHILCDADYMEQGFLSKAWHMLTKDSFRVDIQRVHSEENLQKYVTKYVTKPLSPTFVSDPDSLDEALKSLKGRRLCMCFGDWYGSALTDAEDEGLEFEDVRDYRHFASLEQILIRATAGDRDSVSLLQRMGIDGLWRATLTESPPG